MAEPPSEPFARLSRAGGVRGDDTDLVTRCRDGDVRAFEEIYRRHSTGLYNLALRMVGNASDAEDLLQDVFLTAYGKLSSFRGQATLGTWLYRIATNRCLDHLRKRVVRHDSRTESLEQDGHPLPPGPRESTALRLDLEWSIARLPDSYRAAFVLFDVEGFDHKEVGEILGVAEGTSKSLVHKARMRIRELLGSSHSEVRT